MDTKPCARCRTEKPIDAFRWPHNSYCRICERDYMLQRRASPAGRAARLKERITNREKQRLRRLSVLQHYGGRCVCCGLMDTEFLTIDHPHHDGAAHRRSLRRSNITQWLATHRYPPGYRILCFNCNSAYGFFGYCPHTNPSPEVRAVSRPAWKLGRHQDPKITNATQTP